MSVKIFLLQDNVEQKKTKRTQASYDSLREHYGQPRSQGFSVRTRRDTRKPWSGPVNFAF